MQTDTHFLSYLAQFFLEREMLQTKVVDNIKIHILCSIIFFENRAVYEIMWKNIVEPGRLQMTIWRMRIACWITKATNTRPEYVILIALPLQQWSHESASILRHTFIFCLVSNWDEFRSMRGTNCVLKCIIWGNLHL
jgi:hypothetical protein